MTNFVDALVHAELFLLGVEPSQAESATAPAQAGAAPAPGGPATTTISFSLADYRSAAG